MTLVAMTEEDFLLKDLKFWKILKKKKDDGTNCLFFLFKITYNVKLDIKGASFSD